MCLSHQDENKTQIEEDTKSQLRSNRLKLWEITPHCHCSIIGTCLTDAELQKIGRKAKIDLPIGEDAEYKLHSIMVTGVDHSKGLGRLLHKALDRKYKLTLKQFPIEMTDETADRLWKEAVDQGNVDAAYWAVLSHPHFSLNFKSKVYGEVHMLSHLNSGEKQQQLKDLSKFRENENRLEEELVRVRRRFMETQSSLQQKITALQSELTARENMAEHATELEAKISQLQDGNTMAQLESRVEILSNRVVQESEKVQYQRDKRELLQSNVNELKTALEMRDHRIEELEQELFAMMQNTMACREGVNACSGDENCAGNGDLCGRCIAYIGGQTKLAAFFRDHVEERNGQFLHHDGGLHDGQAKLMNIIDKADAVMFPVTCISHEATREIKQACIQNQKPFMPLRSKGLGAFRRGLESLEGEFFNKIAAE